MGYIVVGFENEHVCDKDMFVHQICTSVARWARLDEEGGPGLDEHYHYSKDWQVLEEQVAGVVQTQYVWTRW